MRQYRGFKYRKNQYDFYELYNEHGEQEAEFISLNELKEAVDNRLNLGYWAY